MLRDDIQIPLHDPGRIIKITGEESVLYRASMLRVFNVVRVVVVMLFLLGFILTGGGTGKVLPFGLGGTNWLSALITLYVAVMSLHWLGSLRTPVSEKIFLSNAVCDAFVLGLLILNLGLLNNSSLLMLSILNAVLLSAMTLTVRQSVVYGVALVVIWMMVAAILQAVPLVPWQKMGEMPWSACFSQLLAALGHDSLSWLEPAVIATGMALLAVLVSYLSTQGRDNRINAELSRNYTRQLRKMNDSISELLPELTKRFGRWQHMRFNDSRTLDIGKGSYSLSFNALKTDEDMPLTLIMLENIDESYQRVRETRLASLGRLTAGIAHEIRNPLSSVQSAADLMEEMSEDPKVHFLTDKIRNNTQRINNIISDILNLFSDKPRNTKLIPLNPFLQAVISEARTNDETSRAKIRSDMDATKEYAVFFDAGHLEQILHNLMLNAVKHAGRDDVEITVRTRIGDVGRFLYIDIQDNGRGVGADDEERIFEPFFSKRHGTGLGLYLVREMCVANQAQIVYVRKEIGACFRLTMERYLANEDDPNEDIHLQ